MSIIEDIKRALNAYVEPEKAEFLPKFFQTDKGGYGEGDIFIGVRIPYQRKIARKYYGKISLEYLQSLLHSQIHEHRSTALIMLVNKFQKAKIEPDKKVLAEFYLANLDFVNNWDLVDLSADKILGPYFFVKDRQILYDLAKSGDLWRQRVAIMSTFHFIRNNDFKDTLSLALMLLNHEHHLIHKAVGWMLREIGKRNFQIEFDFLKEHYQKMPRTMLRYAIEKFDPELRQKFLQGQVE